MAFSDVRKKLTGSLIRRRIRFIGALGREKKVVEKSVKSRPISGRFISTRASLFLRQF
jgi:hypothetical protein